jgi:hypothetical protein
MPSLSDVTRATSKKNRGNAQLKLDKSTDVLIEYFDERVLIKSTIFSTKRAA